MWNESHTNTIGRPPIASSSSNLTAPMPHCAVVVGCLSVPVPPCLCLAVRPVQNVQCLFNASSTRPDAGAMRRRSAHVAIHSRCFAINREQINCTPAMSHEYVCVCMCVCAYISRKHINKHWTHTRAHTRFGGRPQRSADPLHTMPGRNIAPTL